MSGRMIVVGGGAAGLFAAVACAEAAGRSAAVVVVEAKTRCMAKVMASGGGRCNLTNACFSPRELAANYPRGGNELLGPFHVFGPRETIDWFQNRGVQLKIEADGRVFPAGDDAREIVDCLLRAAEAAGVDIRTQSGVIDLDPLPTGGFSLILRDRGDLVAGKLLLAMGGGESCAYALARKLGHTVASPAPALFGLKIDSPIIAGLAGLSLCDCELTLPELAIRERGAVVVTHWGLSGPGVLRLTSRAARQLKQVDYRTRLQIGFAPTTTRDEIDARLLHQSLACGRRALRNGAPFEIPARLWQALVRQAEIPATQTWSHLTRPLRQRLGELLLACEVRMVGMSPNREEMVTAGGVDLREVNLKTMQSKRRANLFLAGELLDIDGLTGGFNLQAAWTTGWLAGRAMADERSL